MLQFKTLIHLARVAYQFTSCKYSRIYYPYFVESNLFLRPLIQLEIKRWKKSQVKSGDRKITLSEKAKIAIDVEEFQNSFKEVLSHLEETYESHFQLYLDPEIILDTKITVLDGNAKIQRPLRQYANIILENNDGLIKQLEIDMSGNTNLLKVAEKSLLNNGISSQPSGTGFSLKVSIPPPTPDRRNTMIKQCKERMHQSMKDMDRIYGKSLKRLSDKTIIVGLGEQDLFDAKDFLRNEVKKAHGEVEKLFEWKKNKLLND